MTKHKKLFYRILADVLFVFHALLLLLIVTGYLFPRFWYPYMAVLAVTLVSDMILGYCLLSKWEFNLRKKWNAAVDYNYSFASYYTYKLTNNRMSDRFYGRAATVFLSLSIMINIYFKFWA